MITVFGSINVDLIFALPGLPAPGETVLGPDVLMQPGGKGANQAVAAARDGAAVAMVGAVGEDGLAGTALGLLMQGGVDIAGVARSPLPTGCAAIGTDPAGRNMIMGGSGASQAARAAQVDDSRLGAGHTVLMQFEVAVEEVSALVARNRGARLVLNLAPPRMLPPEVFRALDILVVNEHEAAWLAGALGVPDDAAALHAALGPVVVRTLGAAGAEFCGRGEAGKVDAHAIEAVDSTAAGDCFIGVMAAGLDRGMDLRAALERASAAAALCCLRRGSQGSLPMGVETDRFVAARRVEHS